MNQLLFFDGFVIFFTILDDFRHMYTIKGQKSGEYDNRQGWHMAAMMEAMLIVGFFCLILGPFYDESFPIIAMTIHLTAIYWILHDAGINLLLGKNIFYIGTTDEVDKCVRKILKHRNFWVYFVLKVILMIIPIFFFFYENN